MCEKIIILNVMTFDKENKETGEVNSSSRIEFIWADPQMVQSSAKYKGYSVIPTFCNGNILNKIPHEAILSPIEATFIEKVKYNDPLSSRKLIESINVNGHVINLL